MDGRRAVKHVGTRLTYLLHPPLQGGEGEERHVLTGMRHRAHESRVGCEDIRALLGEAHAGHGGHVVDVVLISVNGRCGKIKR